MTEKDPRDKDVFARQGLIGGEKVPVLFAIDFKIAKMLYEHADVDIAFVGSSKTKQNKSQACIR